MKCVNCNVDLNTVGLKQVNEVNEELVFEVECLKCRKYNYVSAQAYFLMKKDEGSEVVEPINNKMPADMNVIFCSLQRCGISWIVRVLSMFHEAMFGTPIPYAKENAEISQVIATRQRFPLPEKWNCVYEVDPQQLLDRGYDRVIVVERDLGILKKVHELYFQEDFQWQQRETFFNKLERAWELVYDHDYEDPRYLKINLEDLNNFTVRGFNELMDFLNFPKKGRPPVLPVPTPHRNWETYSTILDKGAPISNKLKNLQSLYNEKAYKKTELVYRLDPRVPYDPDLKRVLVIGPERINGVHFSEKIFEAFQKLGLLVAYLAPADLKDNDYQEYLTKKKRFRISNALEKINFIPDLIFLEECAFYWKNDCSVPLFYKHREFKRPPTVNYPNVAFFWHQGVIPFFEKILAPKWCHRVKHKFPLYVAVDPEQYKPGEKIHSGLSGIGYREDIIYEDVLNFPEISNVADMVLLKNEELEFKKLGTRYFDTPVSNEQYRMNLPMCDAVWIPISTKQFVSRRMLEAMACKTACVIKLENEEHERELENMGFINGEHYVGAQKFSQFKFDKKSLEPVIEPAYEAVMERHTYEQRALEILEIYKDLEFNTQRYDVIVPVYWTNQFFSDNVDAWFREIPVRKLYFGVNNPHLKLICKHPQVEIIDQTHYHTLGSCLADLMKRVETPVFVYLHADVCPMKGSFKQMEEAMKTGTGIVESERLHWDGILDKDVPNYTYTNYHNRKRAFSGYQLVRKEAIEPLLDRIKDDYVYRNEDIVFQAECVQNGFTYEKSWALHVHQVLDSKWTYDVNETNDMQWRGIVKYSNPNEFNEKAFIDSINWCANNLPKEYDFNLTRVLFFCFQYNPNWADVATEALK